MEKVEHKKSEEDIIVVEKRPGQARVEVEGKSFKE